MVLMSINGLTVLYAQTGFSPGNIYFLNRTLPDGNGGFFEGIVRINLGGGTTFLTSHPGPIKSDLSYDAFRDMLIMNTAYEGVLGVTPSGDLVPIPAFPVHIASARGDGLIYFLSTYFYYLDALGNIHILSGAPIEAGTGMKRMFYNQEANALFLAGTSNPYYCSGDGTKTCVIKIPLNEIGTQVEGAITAFEIDVGCCGGPEEPTGLSYGPNTLSGYRLMFLVVAAASQLGGPHEKLPRMLTFDPFSMGSVEVYAQNGPYFGASTTHAGVFSHVLDKALIFDSANDAIRAFSQGEEGEGTIITTGVTYPPGCCATAHLVEIDMNSDPPLPVQLSSFTAAAGDAKINLKWVTQSEVNNVGFEILRALDQNGDYQMIGQKPGQGNSNQPTSYFFEDKFVVNGTTYWYKLVDVDINGVRTEHGPTNATPQAAGIEIITANSNAPTAFKLYPNYPNPFNPSTNLKFDIPHSSRELVNIKVKIFNTLGQEVRKLFIGYARAGTYLLTWDGANDSGKALPGGLYYAVLTAGHYQQTVKMTLMK